MQELPFHIGKFKGHLSRMDKHSPPKEFDIYLPGPKGLLYSGQLLYQQEKWRVFNSKMTEHAEELGLLVEGIEWA